MSFLNRASRLGWRGGIVGRFFDTASDNCGSCSNACEKIGWPLPMNTGTESQVYKLGGRTTSYDLPIWKSAIQQVWKPAVRCMVAMNDLRFVETLHGPSESPQGLGTRWLSHRFRTGQEVRFGRRHAFESGVALRLPPHSKTQARSYAKQFSS